MTKKLLKLVTLILALLLVFTVFASCGGDDNGDAEPTEAPNSSANDAPATTEFVAKTDGNKILSNIFNYFLYDALVEVDFTDLEIPEEATSEEELALRLEFLKKEKEPGLTHFQNVINSALAKSKEFIVSEILAKEAGFAFSEEEIASYNESIDSTADNLLAYYGEAEGCSTRDEIVYAAVGMNVNDYKNFYISQLLVSQWVEDLQTNTFAPTEEQLVEYYNEHEYLYRTVTIRKIFCAYATNDEEGNALTAEAIAENKAAALAKAESYKKLLEDTGLDMGKFSLGFSDEDETSSNGLADLKEQSTYDPALVKWAMAKTAASDTLEIIEGSNGYYIVKVEGITTYTEDSPVVLSESSVSSAAIQASVLSAYKDYMYETYIKEQSSLERFNLTDQNDELTTSLLNKYLEETFG